MPAALVRSTTDAARRSVGSVLGTLRPPVAQVVSSWLDDLVPVIVTELLRRVRVTELVLQHVDVNRVVASVELDEAVSRVDVDRVVGRVDVDAVAERVDVDAVIRRVDVDAILARIDVDAVVRRIDVDKVAQQLDLDAFLGEVDLTALLLRHIDLAALVDACLEQVDLVAMAEQVIEGVDLPEIIRESTGTMASDTVRGVRAQGIAADEAVGRAVDRLLLRRGRRESAADLAGATPSRATTTVPDQARRDTSG